MVKAPHNGTAADIDPMWGRAANGRKLHPNHLADLRKSGLTDATIEAAGLYSEHRHAEIGVMLNWAKPPKRMGSVLVFPFHRPDGSFTGYCRLKPDAPRADKSTGKPIKYESPRQRGNEIYFPPGIAAALADPTAPLVLTEGEKKALAATQEGFACIGLVGVFGWKTKDSATLPPALAAIPWRGRRVYLAFDSDMLTNEKVALAAGWLASVLEAQAAEVRVVHIPAGPEGEDGEPAKVGLDDFLVARGASELHRLLAEATEPDDLPAAELRPDAKYMDPAEEAEKLRRKTERDGSPRLIFHRGACHWWRDGCFTAQQNAEVRASVVRHANESYRHVTMTATGNLLDQVRAACLVPGHVEPGSWLGRVPLLNGAAFPADNLLVTRKQIIHLPSFVASRLDGREYATSNTPAYYATTAMQFELDPDAPPPRLWLEFLDQVLPGDEQSHELLAQWFGYCLVRDTTKHKILFLKGATRSGKGVILRILRAVVGEQNSAGPTLSSLTTNFGLQGLLGKSLATISDARLGGRVDQAIITERLLSISGEDSLLIDRKNLEPVTCKLDCRLVIASNELPKLNDASGALVGRLLVVPFTQSFLGREDDQLTAKLLTELPSILLWSVGGWQRLNDAGRFVQPDSALDELSELADLSSPVRAFVRDCCEISPGCETAVSALFAAWKVWCGKKGREHHGTEQGFGRDLGAAFPGLGRGSRREGSDRWRVYVGIKLKPGA